MSTKEPLAFKYSNLSEEQIVNLFHDVEDSLISIDPFAPKDRDFALAFRNSDDGFVGSGRFVFWFETEKQLLEAIGSYLLITNLYDSTNCKAAFDEIAVFAEQYWNGEIDRCEAIGAINKSAIGNFELQWWGNRDALLFSDEEFPKELRSVWRNGKDEVDTSPLKPDEVEDFLQYISCDYMC